MNQLRYDLADRYCSTHLSVAIMYPGILKHSIAESEPVERQHFAGARPEVFFSPAPGIQIYINVTKSPRFFIPKIKYEFKNYFFRTGSTLHYLKEPFDDHLCFKKNENFLYHENLRFFSSRKCMGKMVEAGAGAALKWTGSATLLKHFL
jgi:hypothetical protein